MHQHLLNFDNTRLNGGLEITTPAITATGSKKKFAPKRANNCRGRGYCSPQVLTCGIHTYWKRRGDSFCFAWEVGVLLWVWLASCQVCGVSGLALGTVAFVWMVALLVLD